MLRSLFSGITGLQNHQTFMDVISNNIANVNTVGYKAGRLVFQDILSQTMSGGTSPSPFEGGTDPMQVGLGVAVGSVDEVHTQGDLENTGVNTDLAIQGDGFFIVNDGTQNLYTRAGDFKVGSDGYLVNAADGQRLQGWMPNVLVGGVPQTDSSGRFLIDTSQPVGDIQIPQSATAPARATANANLQGNLDSTTPVGTTAASQVTGTVVVYDTLGQAHNVKLTFTKQSDAPNAHVWGVTATGDSQTGTITLSSNTVTFDDSGRLTQPAAVGSAPPTLTMTIPYGSGIAAPQTVAVNVGSVTQLSAPSGVTMATQDGYAAGTLSSFTIGQDGTVEGVFTNGATQILGQVALARFPNPAGLVRVGDTDFSLGVNSGLPLVGAPGTSGRGTLASGELEMSNVNLAQEFSNMITAERGFQANARTITTSDQILQDLISLKATP